MIRNITKKKQLAKRVKYCDSFVAKTRGAMFRRRIDHAYIFPLDVESTYAATIHTMFVFTPLTVVWLNAERVIVDKVFAKPWRVYAPNAPAKWVVELPAKQIDNVDIGDYLEFS